MRNRKLMYIIVLIFLGYSLFQIVLYTFIRKKSDDISQKPEKTDSGGKHENPKDSASFVNAKDFVIAAQAHGIPLILLDIPVLNKVINITAPENKKCHFFCELGTVTVFGVLHKLWSHDESFMNSLRKENFSIAYSMKTDHDTLEFLSVDVALYTHYLVHRGTHSIHLVVLYERPAGYWWHGPLNVTALYGNGHHLHHDDLAEPFIREAAYDSMELIKVTMDGLKFRAPRYPISFLRQISHSGFIQCNQSRAKLFYSTYGSPGVDTETFRQAAKLALVETKKTLDYLGIRFWLSSGTCLGWYRQCDTIPYSGDVDIGILIKDYDNRLIPAMQEAGFILKYLFGKESDSFELTFHYEDMKLDIFFFYEEYDHMWNGGTQIKTGSKFKYTFSKITLCWTEFLDVKLPVPCDPETYIQANYGQNWFEPVIKWDWKKSPPNVQENGKWPENELDNVMLSFN